MNSSLAANAAATHDKFTTGDRSSPSLTRAGRFLNRAITDHSDSRAYDAARAYLRIRQKYCSLALRKLVCYASCG